MDQASKRRSWPSPDATMKPIKFNLEEALEVESTYRPNLLVIQEEVMPWEVTIEARDRAVHMLRFLRVWFDAPQDVFFYAVTYLDMFLARVKVQKKYLNCLSVSCFYLAAEKYGFDINIHRLLAASQGNYSEQDMLRLANIVNQKLKLEGKETDRTTTCADFLVIYLQILDYMTTKWETKLGFSEILGKEQLLTRLEVLLGDSRCAFFRSSTLSLVLMKLELEKLMAQGISTKSVDFVAEIFYLLAVLRELQYTCKIKSTELVNCSNNATNVLQQYDNPDRTVTRQPPHDKDNRFSNFVLATIEEKN